jgi:hypothetical protein
MSSLRLPAWSPVLDSALAAARQAGRGRVGLLQRTPHGGTGGAQGRALPILRSLSTRRAQGTTAGLGATWALDALATARLTRLVCADVITEPARERVLAWAYRRHGDTGEVPATGWTDYAHVDPDAPKLASLIVCPWCVSVYVGTGVALARRYLPAWDFIAGALASSQLAGLLAGHEEG